VNTVRWREGETGNIGIAGRRDGLSWAITLVSPFCFIGDAPQRFIFHATLRR